MSKLKIMSMNITKKRTGVVCESAVFRGKSKNMLCLKKGCRYCVDGKLIQFPLFFKSHNHIVYKNKKINRISDFDK